MSLNNEHTVNILKRKEEKKNVTKICDYMHDSDVFLYMWHNFYVLLAAAIEEKSSYFFSFGCSESHETNEFEKFLNDRISVYRFMISSRFKQQFVFVPIFFSHFVLLPFHCDGIVNSNRFSTSKTMLMRLLFKWKGVQILFSVALCFHSFKIFATIHKPFYISFYALRK